jgi:hypothetical protein
VHTSRHTYKQALAIYRELGNQPATFQDPELYRRYAEAWKVIAPVLRQDLADPVTARIVFMKTIQVRAPAVLEDLRERADRHQGSWGDLLQQWADRWHLTKDAAVPAWVMRTARESWAEWRANRWPKTAWVITDGFMRDQLEDGVSGMYRATPESSLPAFTYRKDETKASIRKRLKLYVEDLPRLLEQELEERTAKTKKDLSHFDWAVEFQVLERPVWSSRKGDQRQCIAQSEGGRRAVDSAVSDVLAIVGLDRRREKVGR